jgi:hypothetical protein
VFEARAPSQIRSANRVKKTNPKVALERITTLIRVWSTLRPNSSFYGKTLEQFKAEVKPSLDTRVELETIDQHRDATAVRRNDADVVSIELVNNIVNAIKGHPDEGEDGEVYAGLGYVRRGSRAKGRRRSSEAPEQAAAPANTPEEVKAETK